MRPGWESSRSTESLHTQACQFCLVHWAHVQCRSSEASSAADKVKNAAGDASEKAKGMANEAGAKAKETADAAKQKVGEATS